MARKRFLSTNISTDPMVNKLALEYGDFAALLYTWMIPHAEDDASLPGDPEKLLYTVIPARRDKNVTDIIQALKGMATLGLIIWDEENKKIFFPNTFYKYQIYIPQSRRRCKVNADHSNSAISQQFCKVNADHSNSAKSQQFCEIDALLSLSPSLSLSLSSPDRLSKSGGAGASMEEGGMGGETKSAGGGESENSSENTNENRNPGPGACYRLFEQEFGRPLSPLEAEQIGELEKEFGFELIREALRRAVAQGKRRIRYIRGILENWRVANLRTIQEVLEYERAVEEERARKAPGIHTREPPGDPVERFERQRKKREETVRAAVEFLRLKYRGRLPPREEVEKIARGYGEEFIPAILERFYGGEPP